MLNVVKASQKRSTFGNVKRMYRDSVDAVNILNILMPKINFAQRKLEQEEFALTEHLLEERSVHFLLATTSDEMTHRNEFQQRKIQNTI